MPTQTAPFTFLQVSDVHLDSKLGSGRLALPVSKRLERNREILEALLKLLVMAGEKKVDAVLIPGDLWDSEGVSGQTVNRLLEALDELGETPVVIAPGNHDYLSAASPYSGELLAARGMRPWPDNVHIFTGPEFSLYRHPRRPDVCITGRAFTANVPVSERLLAGAVPRDPDCPVNILLFHGSLDGYRGGDSGLPGKVTAPFSAAELARLGFDYAAVGHYHDCTEIRSDEGELLGAYSGCLVGRTINETGPRVAILGTIDAGGQRAGRCSLEKIEVDRRRVIDVSCDITGLTSAQVMEAVSDLLKTAGARQLLDIVHLRLEGRHPAGGEPTYVGEQLKDAYYHLAVDDRTRPDYLTERYDRRTTEGKFIQAMLDLKKEAAEQGGSLSAPGYDCALTPELIEDALYYGLDALKQKKVTVRYVD